MVIQDPKQVVIQQATLTKVSVQHKPVLGRVATITIEVLRPTGGDSAALASLLDADPSTLILNLSETQGRFD